MPSVTCRWWTWCQIQGCFGFTGNWAASQAAVSLQSVTARRTWRRRSRWWCTNHTCLLICFSVSVHFCYRPHSCPLQIFNCLTFEALTSFSACAVCMDHDYRSLRIERVRVSKDGDAVLLTTTLNWGQFSVAVYMFDFCNWILFTYLLT